MAKPLDSFYHEMAFRNLNAARGQPSVRRMVMRKIRALLTPKVRRVVIAVLGLAVAGVAWNYRTGLRTYLSSSRPHPVGAAETLATVVHRSPPAERLGRLARACALEKDPDQCERALRRLEKLSPSMALACCRLPEVQALRENCFFDQFIIALQKRHASTTLSAVTPPYNPTP